MLPLKHFTYKTAWPAGTLHAQFTHSLCGHSGPSLLSSQRGLAPPWTHWLQLLLLINYSSYWVSLVLLQLLENLVRGNLSGQENNFFIESSFLSSIDATIEIKVQIDNNAPRTPRPFPSSLMDKMMYFPSGIPFHQCRLPLTEIRIQAGDWTQLWEF